MMAGTKRGGLFDSARVFGKVPLITKTLAIHDDEEPSGHNNCRS